MAQLVKLTDEILVNTATTGQQYDAAVAPLSTGGFIVTWDDNELQEVFGRRYDAAGNPVGDQAQINTTTPGTQFFPSVGALTNGGYAVAWQSGTLSNADIFARRYDAGGLPVGNDFLVNSITPGEQLNVKVIGLEGGGFVVLWDTITSGQYQEVRAQIYNASGGTVGVEFTVNTNTADQQGIPVAVAQPGGGFVVIWQSIVPAASNNAELIGQRFDPAGLKLGGEFQVNTTTAQSQYGNDIAALPGGGFVVSWTDPSTDRILARLFDASANPLSGELEVTTAGLPSIGGTSVAAMADGRFVVAWTEGNGSANTVWVRGFLADGTPADVPLAISPGVDFPVLTQDGITALADGTLVIAYDSPSSSSNQDIVFVRLAFPDAGPNDGDDVITSPPEGSSQSGGGGNDTMNGNAGVEIFHGDSGNDTLIGSGGADSLFGDEGNDFIGGDGSGLPGVDGADWLEGGAGNDWISGGDGNDRLDGGSENDVLEGQGGADTMIGGAGDDIFYVDDALDGVFENAGEGNDIVFSSVSRTIDANVETLALIGNAAIDATGSEAGEALLGNDAANVLSGLGGADWMEGRGGNDWLIGGAGNDRLDGGDGDDVLEGGLGFDTLVGGAGVDSFRFSTASDSNFASGFDTIWGFETGIDKVVIVRQGAADSFALTEFSGHTILTVDFGGDGTAEMAIGFANVTNVTAGDVILG